MRAAENARSARARALRTASPNAAAGIPVRRGRRRGRRDEPGRRGRGDRARCTGGRAGSRSSAHPVRSAKGPPRAASSSTGGKQADEFRRHIMMTARSPLKRGALELPAASRSRKGRRTRHLTPSMGASTRRSRRGAPRGGRLRRRSRGRLFSSHWLSTSRSCCAGRTPRLFQLFQGYASVLANLYLDKAHQVRGEDRRKTLRNRRAHAFSPAPGRSARRGDSHGPRPDRRDDITRSPARGDVVRRADAAPGPARRTVLAGRRRPPSRR
jgi:hypothetical protein